MRTKSFAAIAAGLLIGCSEQGYRAENRYQGDLPHEKVAVLKVGQDSDKRNGLLPGHRYLIIHKVDDSRASDRVTLEPVNEIWLLPGKHTVALTFRNENSFATTNLWFVADAGKTYIGKYEMQRFSVRMWIEDAETHQRVGGIKGSDDEPNNEASRGQPHT